MAHFKLVITDPAKAHAARVAQYADAFERSGFTKAKSLALAQEREPLPPVLGDVWTDADDECPFGRPNCRNCGDPAFAETCIDAGHCLFCGTMHGIAPASVLVAKGLTMEAAD